MGKKIPCSIFETGRLDISNKGFRSLKFCLISTFAMSSFINYYPFLCFSVLMLCMFVCLFLLFPGFLFFALFINCSNIWLLMLLSLLSSHYFLSNGFRYATWKKSKYGVSSGPYFLLVSKSSYSVRIQENAG